MATLGLLATRAQAQTCSTKIASTVCTAMVANPSAYLPIRVQMSLQTTQTELDQAAGSATSKEERIYLMVKLLKDHAVQAQETPPCGATPIKTDIMNGVNATPPTAMVMRQMWIEDAVALKAQRSLIEALAARQDVAAIRDDAPVSLGGISSGTCAARTALPATPPQWNVTTIGAAAAWTRTYKGANAVVGVVDTGVYPTHQDLADTGGAPRYVTHEDASHAPYWLDPTMECPTGTLCDNNGRGTYLLSVAVGRAPYGVAPEAKWLACKGVMGDGTACPSHIDQCLQFMMNPDHPGVEPTTMDEARHAADVILVPNDFLTNPAGLVGGQVVSDCRPDDALQTRFDQVRSMNIVPVVPVGDGRGTYGYPTSPANFRTVLTVGATQDASGASNGAIDTTQRSAGVGTLSLCDGLTTGLTGQTRNVASPTVLAPGKGIVGAWTVPPGTTPPDPNPRMQCDGNPSAVAAAQVAGAVALLRGASRPLCADIAPDAVKNPCAVSALPSAYAPYADKQHFVLDEVLRRTTATCTSPAACATPGRINVDQALHDHAELETHSIDAGPYFTEDFYTDATDNPTDHNDAGINVTVHMYNWGPFPWATAHGYALSQVYALWKVRQPPVAPATDSTWAVRSVPLAPGTPDVVVYPGTAPASFGIGDTKFRIRPPATPNSSAGYQWQMSNATQASGQAFGDLAPVSPTTLNVIGTDFPVLQTISPRLDDPGPSDPSSLAGYPCSDVTITAKNNGTSVWTTARYHLQETDGKNWVAGGALYPVSKGGGVYEFKVTNMCAPLVDGSTSFKFDLVRDGAVLIGSFVDRQVVVRNAAQLITGSSTYPTDGLAGNLAVAVTAYKNTGNRAWTPGYCVRKTPAANFTVFGYADTDCVQSGSVVQPGATFSSAMIFDYTNEPSRYLFQVQLNRPDNVAFGDTMFRYVGTYRDYRYSDGWTSSDGPQQGENYFSYRKWTQDANHPNLPGAGHWPLLTRNFVSGEYRFEGNNNQIIRDDSIVPGSDNPAAVFWTNPYGALGGEYPTFEYYEDDAHDYNQCGSNPNGNGIRYAVTLEDGPWDGASEANLINSYIAPGQTSTYFAYPARTILVGQNIQLMIRALCGNATCDRTVVHPRIRILPPIGVGTFPVNAVDPTGRDDYEDWPPNPCGP